MSSLRCCRISEADVSRIFVQYASNEGKIRKKEILSCEYYYPSLDPYTRKSFALDKPCRINSSRSSTADEIIYSVAVPNTINPFARPNLEKARDVTRPHFSWQSSEPSVSGRLGNVVIIFSDYDGNVQVRAVIMTSCVTHVSSAHPTEFMMKMYF